MSCWGQKSLMTAFYNLRLSCPLCLWHPNTDRIPSACTVPTPPPPLCLNQNRKTRSAKKGLLLWKKFREEKKYWNTFVGVFFVLQLCPDLTFRNWVNGSAGKWLHLSYRQTVSFLKLLLFLHFYLKWKFAGQNFAANVPNSFSKLVEIVFVFHILL